MCRNIGGFGVALLLSAAVSLGDAPPQILRGPYSFDQNSPSVQAGLVSPDAVLHLVDGRAVELTSANTIGLGQPGDDLDALSSSNVFAPTMPVAILFSVDRASVGVAPPDPLLVSNGIPYNVFHQAERGHAAGDQFMSTDVFLLGGNIAGIRILGSGSNNSQVRNNFDEGGTSFGADPKTNSSSTSTGGEGDVDGTSGTAAAMGIAAGETGPIYFSMTPASPSLVDISSGQPPSGASIFFHEAAGASPVLWASFADLGLLQNDDVNAMVVLERDGLPGFSGPDEVLFSLAPGSPSLIPGARGQQIPGLLDIPGLSASAPAADVLVASAGGGIRVLAHAAQLGLGWAAADGTATDNIDALDLLPCSDGFACAMAHSIRADTVPAVSEWGLVVFMLAVMATGTVLVRRGRAQTV